MAEIPNKQQPTLTNSQQEASDQIPNTSKPQYDFLEHLQAIKEKSDQCTALYKALYENNEAEQASFRNIFEAYRKQLNILADYLENLKPRLPDRSESLDREFDELHTRGRKIRIASKADEVQMQLTSTEKQNNGRISNLVVNDKKTEKMKEMKHMLVPQLNTCESLEANVGASILNSAPVLIFDENCNKSNTIRTETSSDVVTDNSNLNCSTKDLKLSTSALNLQKADAKPKSNVIKADIEQTENINNYDVDVGTDNVGCSFANEHTFPDTPPLNLEKSDVKHEPFATKLGLQANRNNANCEITGDAKSAGLYLPSLNLEKYELTKTIDSCEVDTNVTKFPCVPTEIPLCDLVNQKTEQNNASYDVMTNNSSNCSTTEGGRPHVSALNLKKTSMNLTSSIMKTDIEQRKNKNICDFAVGTDLAINCVHPVPRPLHLEKKEIEHNTVNTSLGLIPKYNNTTCEIAVDTKSVGCLPAPDQRFFSLNLEKCDNESKLTKTIDSCERATDSSRLICSPTGEELEVKQNKASCDVAARDTRLSSPLILKKTGTIPKSNTKAHSEQRKNKNRCNVAVGTDSISCSLGLDNELSIPTFLNLEEKTDQHESIKTKRDVKLKQNKANHEAAIDAKSADCLPAIHTSLFLPSLNLENSEKKCKSSNIIDSCDMALNIIKLTYLPTETSICKGAVGTESIDFLLAEDQRNSFPLHLERYDNKVKPPNGPPCVLCAIADLKLKERDACSEVTVDHPNCASYSSVDSRRLSALPLNLEKRAVNPKAKGSNEIANKNVTYLPSRSPRTFDRTLSQASSEIAGNTDTAAGDRNLFVLSEESGTEPVLSKTKASREAATDANSLASKSFVHDVVDLNPEEDKAITEVSVDSTYKNGSSAVNKLSMFSENNDTKDISTKAKTITSSETTTDDNLALKPYINNSYGGDILSVPAPKSGTTPISIKTKVSCEAATDDNLASKHVHSITDLQPEQEKTNNEDSLGNPYINGSSGVGIFWVPSEKSGTTPILTKTKATCEAATDNNNLYPKSSVLDIADLKSEKDKANNEDFLDITNINGSSGVDILSVPSEKSGTKLTSTKTSCEVATDNNLALKHVHKIVDLIPAQDKAKNESELTKTNCSGEIAIDTTKLTPKLSVRPLRDLLPKQIKDCSAVEVDANCLNCISAVHRRVSSHSLNWERSGTKSRINKSRTTSISNKHKGYCELDKNNMPCFTAADIIHLVENGGRPVPCLKKTGTKRKFPKIKVKLDQAEEKIKVDQNEALDNGPITSLEAILKDRCPLKSNHAILHATEMKAFLNNPDFIFDEDGDLLYASNVQLNASSKPLVSQLDSKELNRRPSTETSTITERYPVCSPIPSTGVPKTDPLPQTTSVREQIKRRRGKPKHLTRLERRKQNNLILNRICSHCNEVHTLEDDDDVKEPIEEVANVVFPYLDQHLEDCKHEMKNDENGTSQSTVDMEKSVCSKPLFHELFIENCNCETCANFQTNRDYLDEHNDNPEGVWVKDEELSKDEQDIWDEVNATIQSAEEKYDGITEIEDIEINVSENSTPIPPSLTILPCKHAKDIPEWMDFCPFCDCGPKVNYTGLVVPDFCRVDRNQTTCGAAGPLKRKNKKSKGKGIRPKVNKVVKEKKPADNATNLKTSKVQVADKQKESTDENIGNKRTAVNSQIFANILDINLIHDGNKENRFIRKSCLVPRPSLVGSMTEDEKDKSRSHHTEDWAAIFSKRVSREFPLIGNDTRMKLDSFSSWIKYQHDYKLTFDCNKTVI